MLLIQLVLDLNIRPSRLSSFWDESVAAHPAVYPPSAQRRLSPDPHFGIPAGPLISHSGLKQLGVTIPIWKMRMSSGSTSCCAHNTPRRREVLQMKSHRGPSGTWMTLSAASFIKALTHIGAFLLSAFPISLGTKSVVRLCVEWAVQLGWEVKAEWRTNVEQVYLVMLSLQSAGGWRARSLFCSSRGCRWL